MTIEELQNKKIKLQDQLVKINQNVQLEIEQIDSQISSLETIENLQKSSLEELVNKYDYDLDGIISVIDVAICMKVISTYALNMELMSNDPKFNKDNLTYNGKSLDIQKDDSVEISDAVVYINSIQPKSILDKYMDIAYDSFDTNCNLYYNTYNKNANDVINKIQKFYDDNNYTWPTLEQLPELLNDLPDKKQINENQLNLLDSFDELVEKYDYNNDGKVDIVDWVIMDLYTRCANEENDIFLDDPKYDIDNGTYDGKEIDVYQCDYTTYPYSFNKYGEEVKNIFTQYFDLQLKDFNPKLHSRTYDAIKTKILNYYLEHNRIWPTLEDLQNS